MSTIFLIYITILVWLREVGHIEKKQTKDPQEKEAPKNKNGDVLMLTVIKPSTSGTSTPGIFLVYFKGFKLGKFLNLGRTALNYRSIYHFCFLHS